ncbi:hypothetical protein [Klebsiella oxytoca]|uniref:hypothetical protein n=1 Tax=Klebsiella oxytoca TaxID=571 RepID=UPI001C8E3989|nr:hypothetical protein [Klebsiella oxytoca]
MNIETVNELIQSLESAGELSIKERKYLELAKAYQQLAAENVALKASIPPMKMINDVTDSWDDVSLAEEVGFNRAISAIMKNIPETPATDRIVAGIKADGVALAKSAFEKHIQSTSCYQDEMVGMESALSIACQVESQLREGADK